MGNLPALRRGKFAAHRQQGRTRELEEFSLAAARHSRLPLPGLPYALPLPPQTKAILARRCPLSLALVAGQEFSRSVVRHSVDNRGWLATAATRYWP